MERFRVLVVAIVVGAVSAAASAQGVQTSALRGVVRDEQGLPIPGAAVSVTSPALQGERHATTANDGAYVFRTLPPGTYAVHIAHEGFSTVTEQVTLPLGGDVEQSVTVPVGRRQESVQVAAAAPSAISSSTVGANYTRAEIEALPMARTLGSIAELSPGLTNVTPNSQQVSINGATAFDSVFLLNGVAVDDNLFGSPQSLFVEDAIQEVQTLTSGISAEYGRFTGGVVNAITKSGGNLFSGSLRLNLSNPSWSTKTPFEASRNLTHPDTLSKSTEATLGGPIVANRFWFFSAFRRENLTTSQAFPQTGIANAQTDKNWRAEIKGTATVAPGHTAQAGYTNNETESLGRPSIPGFSIDPFTVATADIPNWMAFANYRGALTPTLLAEVQYTERRWSRKAGGTDTSVVESPFIALSVPAQYNAPYFDLADPEDRNNKQFTGSVTSFLNGAGRHEVKAGYEWFRNLRTGGGGQTATDLVFHADYATDAAGNPLYDASQHLIPVFVPGVTLVEQYIPKRNVELHVDTQSLYAQDHWSISDRLSADVGLRFEQVASEATGAVKGIDTRRVVPRLALAYDVSGNGKIVAHATYGHYSGRYNEHQIAANTNVGNSDELIRVYVGAPGRGRSFAPGFSAANYQTVAGIFPTANVTLAPELSSPVTKEFTTSLGAELGVRGYGEVTYVFRRTSNLIEDQIALSNGTTHVVRNGVDAGTFTNIVYANSDVATRQYQGLLLQSRYRISNRWALNGHYTLMLQDDGNYEGEATNEPGKTSPIGDYPQAFNEARTYPMGRLQDFQRHKLRIWTTYDLGFGRGGDVSLSGLWRVNSGQVYSLKAALPLTAVQNALLAAYPDAPGTQVVFFGPRGSETFEGYGVLDTTITYNVPVFRSLKPWVKFDVFNLFDNLKQIGWNTVITPDPASPKDSLGLPTGYLKSAAFGTANSNAQFPAPLPGVTGGRTLRVAVGFRF